MNNPARKGQAFRRGRFKSKSEALHMRVHVWVCSNCGTQHKTTKPERCQTCAHGAFFHFDSITEANRFAQLALLQNHGQILNLRLQVPFPIYHNGKGVLSKEKAGKPLFRYYADFVYDDTQGRRVIEDTKGHEVHGLTDVFKLKKKIIEAVYQIEIKLT